jgi:hypothetical protein
VIFAAPSATPVASPLPETTEATPALLLVQVPPPGVPLNVAVEPTHIPEIPVTVGAVKIVTAVVIGPVLQEFTPFTFTDTVYTPADGGGVVTLTFSVTLL